MKKFYAILKGVFAVMMASTLLMTSCNPYTPHETPDEFKGLNELMSKLEEYVEDEMATFATLINDQTVVTEATSNPDGSWTLLLASEESTVVTPKSVAAAIDANGRLSVKEANGEYYWAIMENGKVTPVTDNGGNMVAVAGNTPEFRINSSNKLEFSVGDSNWFPVPSAVDGSKLSCFTHIVTDVEDTKDAVLVSLASGDTIIVKKAQSADFGVKAGKTYFKAGESIAIGLIVENVSELVVLSTPKGWNAVIEDKVITITAPSANKLTSGEADLEGVVTIQATDSEGNNLVGKIAVSASEQTLKITIKDENITIEHSYKDAEGNTIPFYYGMTLRSEFSTDAVAEMCSSKEQGGYCQSNENSVSVSATELYNQIYNNSKIPAGNDYVVWAIVDNTTLSGDDVVYTLYAPKFVAMNTLKVAFNEIEISVRAGGYDSYQVGLIEASSEASALESLQSNLDYFNMGWGDLGTTIDNLDYVGSISKFYANYEMSVAPNSGYMAFVLPITKGRDVADYKLDDIEYLFVKSANLAEGGQSVVSATANATLNSIEATVSASAGTSMIYYFFFRNGSESNYSTDADIINYMMQMCPDYGSIIYGESGTVSAQSLTSGASVTLCAFAVDKSGKYGELYREQFTTKELSFNDSMVITIDESASRVSINSVSVKFDVTGGTPAKYIYAAVSVDSWMYGDLSEASSAANYLVLNTDSYGVWSSEASEVVNNTLTVGELETGVEHIFAMIAVDADGAPSQAALFSFTPNIPTYSIVRNSDARWEATKPAYTIDRMYDADYGTMTYSFTVTPSEGSILCWAALADTEYIPVGQAAKVGIDKMLLATANDLMYGGSVEFDGEYTSPYIPSYSSNVYFHLIWMDADGNIYQAIEERALPTLVQQSDARWSATQPTITCTADTDAKSVAFTVTPGENTKKMWVYFYPETNYYDAEVFANSIMNGMPGAVECTEEYSTTVSVGAGASDAAIYVAWEDNDGNLYMYKSQKCF